MLTVKASDLKFKYPKDIVHRDEPRFSGLPDPAPFNLKTAVGPLYPVVGSSI